MTEDQIIEEAFDLAQKHSFIDRWVHDAHLAGEFGEASKKYKIGVTIDGYSPQDKSRFNPSTDIELFACAEEAVRWGNEEGAEFENVLDRFRQNFLLIRSTDLPESRLTIPKPTRSIWDTLRTSTNRELEGVIHEIVSDSSEDDL